MVHIMLREVWAAETFMRKRDDQRILHHASGSFYLPNSLAMTPERQTQFL